MTNLRHRVRSTPALCFLLLLLQVTGGSGLHTLSSPETYGSSSSDGPVTQHKKVRCFKQNVKVGDDDRNYEIEQIRKNCVAVLFVCGSLQAVTITPLPYRGDEPGYRLPRGTATFLDQEEASRIRRQMLGDRGFAGFYGGGRSDRSRYDSYDGGDRYGGNEIDTDVYFDKRSRDYYPNYNPDGGSRNTWAQDCFPRGEPYENNGISSYNLARSGYINRRGYDDNTHGIYNKNKVRGFEGRSRGYQPRYDTNRGGFVDMWSRGGYYGSSDKDDTVREGTVGFYGRSRRQ